MSDIKKKKVVKNKTKSKLSYLLASKPVIDRLTSSFNALSYFLASVIF